MSNFFFYSQVFKWPGGYQSQCQVPRPRSLCSSKPNCVVCFWCQIKAFSFDVKHLKYTEKCKKCLALFPFLSMHFTFLRTQSPFYPTVILLDPSHPTPSVLGIFPSLQDLVDSRAHHPRGKLEMQRLTFPASFAVRAWALRAGGSILISEWGASGTDSRGT